MTCPPRAAVLRSAAPASHPHDLQAAAIAGGLRDVESDVYIHLHRLAKRAVEKRPKSWKKYGEFLEINQFLRPVGLKCLLKLKGIKAQGLGKQNNLRGSPKSMSSKTRWSDTGLWRESGALMIELPPLAIVNYGRLGEAFTGYQIPRFSTTRSLQPS